MDISYLFTSTAGRIPQRDWWMGAIILAIVMIVAILIVSFGFDGMYTTVGRVLFLVVELLVAYPFFCLSAKRFQDRGKPGNFALILIAVALLYAILNVLWLTGNPYALTALDYILSIALIIVGLWYLIELGFLRGTVGANEYGPDPLEAPRRM